VIPANPTLCVGAFGLGYLLWMDRRPGGLIWFAHIDPDSLVQSMQPLSWESGGSSSYAAVVDSLGKLYVLWNQSSAAGNALMFQTRSAFEPFPDENVFATLDLPLESLALEVDGQRSIHIAYALSGAGGYSLRYRRKWPDNYWDVTSTDLSFPPGDQGGEPIVLPRRDGNVDIMYAGIQSQQTRLMIRRRVLTPTAPLGLKVEAPRAETPLRLAPNPARAGSSLELRADAAPAGTEAVLDVFDTGGRRVASVPVAANGAQWVARVPSGVTRGWPSGVYFARMRGASRTARVVVVR
jgi:hypothetical protein